MNCTLLNFSLTLMVYIFFDLDAFYITVDFSFFKCMISKINVNKVRLTCKNGSNGLKLKLYIFMFFPIFLQIYSVVKIKKRY